MFMPHARGGVSDAGDLSTVMTRQPQTHGTQVDVRVILPGLDGGYDSLLGDDDLISLGVVSGALTVGDVKASASFGLQQLGVGADVMDYTPDRTRLILRSTGEVLDEEEREVRFIDPKTPSLMLLLVPREMESSIRAALANEDVTGEGRADQARADGAADAFRVSSRMDDDFEVLSLEQGDVWGGGGGAEVKFTNTSCSLEVTDNFNGTYWMNFSFVARWAPQP